MERMPSDEERLLSLRESSTLGWTDQDPTLLREEKEIRFLAKPEYIRDSVKSIFGKYAEGVTVDGKVIKYTPEIELGILDPFAQEYGMPSGSLNLFVSHLASDNLFAIIRKRESKGRYIHLPAIVISGENSNTEIRNKDNQLINEEDSLVYVRRLINTLKQAHEKRVREEANFVIIEYIDTTLDGSLQSLEGFNFYINDTENPKSKYKLDSMSNPPSRALELSMFDFYKHCPEIRPTPQRENHLQLYAVTATSDNREVELPFDALQPLFNELVHFDIDDHHLRPLRLKKLHRESIN